MTLAVGLVALVYATVGHAGATGYIALMTLFGMSAEVIRPTAHAEYRGRCNHCSTIWKGWVCAGTPNCASCLWQHPCSVDRWVAGSLRSFL